MSFLAPLFLVGAVAVGLPVLFHLIRRTTRDKRAFSSLRFLDPTPPRITRKSRLEHILLLVLRCLGVILLALGFSRPFWSRTDPASESGDSRKQVIVLLDSSASMQREDLWQQAVAHSRSVINSMGPADEFELVSAGRHPRILFSFDQWNRAAVSERKTVAANLLNQLKPGWEGTHLAEALIFSAGQLQEAHEGKTNSVARQEIVLVSDFQEGARWDALQSFEWPKKIEVRFKPVQPRKTGNAGLSILHETDETLVSSENRIKVRVANHSSSRSDQFQVRWDADASSVSVSVPPGESRVVSLPIATNRTEGKLVLSGDDIPFDNAAYAAIQSPTRIRILFLGDESPKNPSDLLYYVLRAFSSTRTQNIEVESIASKEPADASRLASAHFYILSDTLPASRMDAIRDLLASGRTALVVARTPAIAETLARMTGHRFPVSEAGVSRFALWEQIEFQNPLFAPFAESRFSDFTKIHFWKYRKIDLSSWPEARVLARYEGGSPGLWEAPVGKGRIWVLMSGWQPDDSQLALSSKFVPILYSFLEQSGLFKFQTAQYLVGDAVRVEIPGTQVTVQKPDGSTAPLTGTVFDQADQPGIYRVRSSAATNRFAVNLDPQEGRVGFNVPELFLHSPSTDSNESGARKSIAWLRNIQLENRQKLWRLFLLGALVILFSETWLAARCTAR